METKVYISLWYEGSGVTYKIKEVNGLLKVVNTYECIDNMELTKNDGFVRTDNKYILTNVYTNERSKVVHMEINPKDINSDTLIRDETDVLYIANKLIDICSISSVYISVDENWKHSIKYTRPPNSNECEDIVELSQEEIEIVNSIISTKRPMVKSSRI